MKTKFTSLFLGLVLTFMLVSFSDPYLKKRITDKQFKYEFYTTHKKVNPKSDVIYYWFKGGAIHTSQEGIAGELLEDQFDKFYLNNQLAEKGKFRNGKKVGIWRTWHPNGILATEEEWAGGQKNGKFLSYDDSGILAVKGYYRSDKKQGKWIYSSNHETLNYQNDKIVIQKQKKNKDEKLNSKKTESTSEIEVVKDEIKKTSKKKVKSEPKDKPNQKKNSDKKDGFFKRLFSKKDKTKPTNAKGS